MQNYLENAQAVVQSNINFILYETNSLSINISSNANIYRTISDNDLTAVEKAGVITNELSKAMVENSIFSKVSILTKTGGAFQYRK